MPFRITLKKTHNLAGHLALVGKAYPVIGFYEEPKKKIEKWYIIGEKGDTICVQKKEILHIERLFFITFTTGESCCKRRIITGGESGKCCCNCDLQCELFGHPTVVDNSTVCTPMNIFTCSAVRENKHQLVLNTKHGLCECWNKRKI